MICLITLQMALAAFPVSGASCDPNDLQSCVQPMLKGETAPFSGQLLTFRRAANLVVFKLQMDERILAEVDLVKGKLQAELRGLEAIHASDQRYHVLEIELLTQRLKEAHDASATPWYKTPTVVAVVTVAATTAVFMGAVRTVEALR